MMAMMVSVVSPLGAAWEGLQKEMVAAMDQKIYRYVVLGRLLQGAAAVLCAGSVVLGFTYAPLALLGVISAVACAVLGTHLTSRQAGGSSFIPEKPVGLPNEGNDCWLNASLQLILHAANLENRARQVLLSSFAQMVQQYRTSQHTKEEVALRIHTKELRSQLSILTGGAMATGNGQEDAVCVFDHILGGAFPLHRWVEYLDGVATNHIKGDGVIRLLIEHPSSFAFDKAWHQFFDATADNGRRIQLFFQTPPPDLVVQLPRFYQKLNAHRTIEMGKIGEDLNIPERFSMPKEGVLTGESAAYVCDGFIEHIGSSVDEGHYVAYVKKGEQWWLCNDAHIIAVASHAALAAMRRGYLYHFLRSYSL
jgi:hypothetical protein